MIKLMPEYGGFNESEEGIISKEELCTEESLTEEYIATLHRISQIEEEIKKGIYDDEKNKLLNERKEYLHYVSGLLKNVYTDKIRHFESYIEYELKNIDENPSITETNILFAKNNIEILKQKILELQ